METQEILNKEKKIVIARLELVSTDLYFSDGNNENAYSRDDMIGLIENDDEVGVEFVRTELEFLRAFKSGELIRRLA